MGVSPVGRTEDRNRVLVNQDKGFTHSLCAMLIDRQILWVIETEFTKESISLYATQPALNQAVVSSFFSSCSHLIDGPFSSP